MKKLQIFLASVFLSLIAVIFSAQAGTVGNPIYWFQDGTSLLLVDPITEIGSSTDKIPNAWFEEANIASVNIDAVSATPLIVDGASPTSIAGDGDETSIGGDLEIVGGDLEVDIIHEYNSGSGITLADTTTMNELLTLDSVVYSGFFDNGNSGTGATIDFGTGNMQEVDWTGNVTFAFTDPSGPCSVNLKLLNDGTGGYTVAWPASVMWHAGTEPTWTTTASELNVISCLFDGTTYLCDGWTES